MENAKRAFEFDLLCPSNIHGSSWRAISPLFALPTWYVNIANHFTVLTCMYKVMMQHIYINKRTFLDCSCSEDESTASSSTVVSSDDPTVGMFDKAALVVSGGQMTDASGITPDDSLGAMNSNCCGLVAGNDSAVSASWSAAEVFISLSQSTYGEVLTL